MTPLTRGHHQRCVSRPNRTDGDPDEIIVEIGHDEVARPPRAVHRGLDHLHAALPDLLEELVESAIDHDCASTGPPSPCGASSLARCVSPARARGGTGPDRYPHATAARGSHRSANPLRPPSRPTTTVRRSSRYPPHTSAVGHRARTRARARLALHPPHAPPGDGSGNLEAFTTCLNASSDI